MTLLTRHGLGLEIREIVRKRWRFSRDAALDLNMDSHDLRRCWAAPTAGRHRSFDTLLGLLRRLGYEVHFEIRPISALTSHNGTLNVPKLSHEQPRQET